MCFLQYLYVFPCYISTIFLSLCRCQMIQVDLGGQLPFPLNQHFEPMVLINHDIHPFDGEWNVIPYPFVNYRHHVMIS
jgi:hypothetical protein